MQETSNRGPDFVIAGAARAGTTHLYHLCSLQPDIYMAQPVNPEPKFFTRSELYEKGTEWYINSYFKGAKKEQIWGEKSVEYLESKAFPANAQRYFPMLKIIVLLRNPIDRTVSNYWWSVKNGMETRSMREAIEQEMAGGIEENGTVLVEKTRPHVYLGRSLYYKALSAIYDHFPAENILLIDFHRYRADIKSAIKQLEGFLDVPFPVFSADIDKNPGLSPRPVEKDLLDKMRDLFAPDIEKVNKTFNMNLSLEYGT
jgi:hypothetical protein